MGSIEYGVLTFPLVFVLLSLAVMPLIAPKFWQKWENTAFAVISVISILSLYSIMPEANHILKETLIDDYLPFIIMLFTLYILSHGIHIQIRAASHTETTIIFLACSSLFSSLIGTTGASMLFLRPFLEINKDRQYKSHLIIFFIFLVSNIGGLLTPLGDPPLLLGYLHGIDFFWEIKHLFGYWFIYLAICLGILYVIDKIVLKKEALEHHLRERKFSLEITGWTNVTLILVTVIVLAIEINIYIKDIILLLFCGISLYASRTKSAKIDFAPFGEVARTFLVIFIVIAPVLFILNTNSDEIHKYIIDMSNGTDGSKIYFWLCSLASSFLDNAPSYLLFFNMAGGNPQELMYVYPNVLSAISVSSVVMGAMTYIGNAPNMMVKSIATKKGIKMPSFIGYMLWSCVVILPISYVVSYIIAMGK
ncbi:MAG: sodium:proton antiporter [Alphaproteobacteria bacterium]|nr:sodium:proton antiporter [Alphaproteobacteria bacterium]